MSGPVEMLRAASATNAIAQLFAGVTANRQGQAEAEVLTNEARVTGQQTVAAMDAQRRQARQFLSMQSTAIGQAGIGYGGSSAKLREQSAIEAELEALNIRYAGELKRQGLLTQAGFAKAKGRAGLIGSGLAAGSALLSGEGDITNYLARERLNRGY